MQRLLSWRYEAWAGCLALAVLATITQTAGAQRFDRGIPAPRAAERAYDEPRRFAADHPRPIESSEEYRRTPSPRLAQEWPAEPSRVTQTSYEWHPTRRSAPKSAARVAQRDDFEGPRITADAQTDLVAEPEPEVEIYTRPTTRGGSPAGPGGSRTRGRGRTYATQYELPPQGESSLRAQPEYVDGVPGGGPSFDDGSAYGPEEAYGDGPDGDWHGAGGCPVCGGHGGPCCPRQWLDESSLLVGVHSFKNGLDQGRNGNFGFQEGVNFAGALWHQVGLGYQVGALFTQSNLSGNQVTGLRDNSRDQVFLTSGIFQRALYGHGWQWGAVFDWMQDRYYVNTQFSQIRAELSYLACCGGHEVGFWGAFGTGPTQSRLVNGTQTAFDPTDLYAFFYRKNLPTGGQARAWGGFTGNSGGLVGADYRIPVSNRWDFIGGFNYLIPAEGKGTGGNVQESWGLALNIVWYPTRSRCGVHNGPYRSLLNVADNNVFMINKVK